MNSEIAAFENFKFKIGDLVVHVTGDTMAGIIRERVLAQTTSGFYRAYEIAFRDGCVYAEEIELEPYRRPVCD